MYAAWVQPETISDKATTDATLARVKALGIDTAFLCMSGSPVYWRSKLLPNSGRVTSTFDPLAYAITVCRSAGISPHVWWCAGLISQDGNVRSRYPGTSVADVVAGLQHWLYFGNATAQKLCADVCAEIAAYQPDGVHLDVIRYQYDIAYITWDNPRPEFSAQHVTDTVKACRAAVKAPVELTAACFPNAQARRDHLQPWDVWIRDQLVDHVVMMAYTDELAKYQAWIAEWNALTGRERIVPGMMLWVGSETSNGLRMITDIAAQVEAARAAGYGSFCLFDNRGFGLSTSMDEGIKVLTGGGGTMSAITDLRALEQRLRERATQLDQQVQALTTSAADLRAQADEAKKIADGLMAADALADQLAEAL